MPNLNVYALIGLGREGYSSYTYLRSVHPTALFVAYDDKNALNDSEKWQKVAKIDKKIVFFQETNEFLAEFKEKCLSHPGCQIMVLKTPGVPPSHPLVQTLKARPWSDRVRWTSNTSLFFENVETINTDRGNRRLVTIGVTGTKGKSTTTSLIHHVLATAGLPVVLGGNIGKPPLDLLPELEQLLRVTPEEQSVFVVLELSSHQLSDLSVSPHVAVIQEIVPEHLDYYPDFESYVAAKSHIARYQRPEDLVIYNSDYTLLVNVATLSPGRHVTFTTDQCPAQISQIVPLEQLPLKGSHNLLNVMPSLLIAREYGLSTEVLREALLSFKPLPHRIELVATREGVTYFNDSLSTTPGAAVAAIRSFPRSTVILLAGGYDRHLDYSSLGRTIIEQQVKAVLLFPTTGQRIRSAVEAAAKTANAPLPTLVSVTTMAQAVEQARSIATRGDIVLLSPASASFNMYKDYQERGEAFKMEVEHARERHRQQDK